MFSSEKKNLQNQKNWKQCEHVIKSADKSLSIDYCRYFSSWCFSDERTNIHDLDVDFLLYLFFQGFYFNKERKFFGERTDNDNIYELTLLMKPEMKTNHLWTLSCYNSHVHLGNLILIWKVSKVIWVPIPNVRLN